MKTILTITLCSALFGAAAARAAPPPPLRSDAAIAAVRMPKEELAALRREVQTARALDARPFLEVERIVALAPGIDARARARRAPIALYVARMGPSALMPALELLAVNPPRVVPAASAPAVRRALIEAVGMLRDARALHVLIAILEDTTEDPETTRAATEASARIGTEAAAEAIVSALERASGDRARAVIAGMGECRRSRVVEVLAERLRTAPDEATARAAARSLGRAGSAWVWPTLPDRREEALIREAAARALVDAFVRNTRDVRVAASNALMIVDAPQTPALIAAARTTAPPATAKALDELAARFARNPARVR